ncbi:hypothetical protein BDQ17DRAFT_1347079 [Cyathus striatus]|nr:hypothetical protein BDQ17DRAFT_1347079 [Cyathus striatus]
MAQTSNTGSPGLKRTTTTLTFAQQQAGLLVTNELNKAIEECREKVRRISRECRMKNRKFRDIEFDLENDKYRCLEGLFTTKGYSPSDVQRVTQIFEQPKFYAMNGALGDCWFMSALATVSSCTKLIEKFCVERDEAVGVYGFIFFKNNAWVNVIIDDLLYTRTPKYEELKRDEQELYHFDKEAYNKSARRGGKQLYFAKSGNDGETWVPLLEKAYAKLHGCYAAISGGWDCEAIEDMTGYVFVPVNDILDTDRFWTEELLRVNKDRLFGCSFDPLSQLRNGRSGSADVQGLVGGHAYSVLRAVDCRGKRFVVIRNPWGKTEWNGPWSDGSKEWNGKWLEILPELGHEFGDDGQFVMEYKDFLNVWKDIDRTVIFDESWVMSSQWLHIPMRPLPLHGITFSLSGSSLAVIVLSQLDRRYFNDISGRSAWSLDFVLVKEGVKEPVAVSNHAWLYTRSVNLEMELEAGNYIVYVRIDRTIQNKDSSMKIEEYQLRQLSRVLAEKSKSQSIVSSKYQEQFATITVTDLIEKDYAQYEKKRKEKEEKEKQKKTEEQEEDKEGSDGSSSWADAESDNDSDEVTTTTTMTTVVVTKKSKKEAKAANTKPLGSSAATPASASGLDSKAPRGLGPKDMKPSTESDTGCENVPAPIPVVMVDNEPPVPYSEYLSQDDHNLFLGLKVYTKKEVPVTIEGRLRAELDVKLTQQNEQPPPQEVIPVPVAYPIPEGEVVNPVDTTVA